MRRVWFGSGAVEGARILRVSIVCIYLDLHVGVTWLVSPQPTT